ncbi:MAG: rhamnulokinase [Bacteroidales bacterium]|nr:rhamnulokinase [Bacteroidales bacterium]
MRKFLAIDIGATSGRAILGVLDGGRLTTEEIARFPNRIIREGGHWMWDLQALFEAIVEALRTVADREIEIESVGIDTWGVDFALFGKDGRLMRNPYCYRDPYTAGEPERFFARVPAEKVYDITGIQVMDFNSLFQLSALRREGDAALDEVGRILFIPDALSYLLTGRQVCEYTIASTSQLLNPRTKEFSGELLDALGLQRSNFGEMVQPGTTIGTLTPEVQRLTGLGPVAVKAVAGHDTASAVAAVPASDRHFAYLSSGTWSLMGIESETPIITAESRAMNFTNEGGLGGTVRFLKNICGMWLLEQCRAEWGDVAYDSLIEEALAEEPFGILLNPDEKCFSAPPSMTAAIRDWCRATGQRVPERRGEYTRAIFDSLALRYRQVFGWLKDLASFDMERLHIIGGGARNRLLNQFTANALGVTVIAGPVECTAIGNIMVQAAEDNPRGIIAASVMTETFTPQDTVMWDITYDKYIEKLFTSC